jgi:hypothetical protein
MLSWIELWSLKSAFWSFFHQYIYRTYNIVTIYGISSPLISLNELYFEMKPISHFFLLCSTDTRTRWLLFPELSALSPRCKNLSDWNIEHLMGCSGLFLICTSSRSRNGGVNRNVKLLNAENLQFSLNMEPRRRVRGVKIKLHTS